MPDQRTGEPGLWDRACAAVGRRMAGVPPTLEDAILLGAYQTMVKAGMARPADRSAKRLPCARQHRGESRIHSRGKPARLGAELHHEARA